ncbi:MAG: heavy-metal-associated domain-containing protein [Odoribacter splanchnicus]
MKVIRLILIMTVMLSVALSVSAQKKNEKTVVFVANLHCESCKAKVEKNLPFEKGVKDLKVDMKKQTITVTFREDKNTTENLQKAIEKLNIEVKGIEGNNTSAKAKTGEKCEKSCCEKEGKTK